MLVGWKILHRAALGRTWSSACCAASEGERRRRFGQPTGELIEEEYLGRHIC